MRQAYVATIKVSVLAQSEAEACDALSSILSEQENRHNEESAFLDWAYRDQWKPRRVHDRDQYEEGEAFQSEERIALMRLAKIGQDGILERRQTGMPTWYALQEVAKIANEALADES